MKKSEPKFICSELWIKTLLGVALALFIGIFINFFPFGLLIQDVTLCAILYGVTVICVTVALCASAVANELCRWMQCESVRLRKDLHQEEKTQILKKSENSDEHK